MRLNLEAGLPALFKMVGARHDKATAPTPAHVAIDQACHINSKERVVSNDDLFSYWLFVLIALFSS